MKLTADQAWAVIRANLRQQKIYNPSAATEEIIDHPSRAQAHRFVVRRTVDNPETYTFFVLDDPGNENGYILMKKLDPYDLAGMEISRGQIPSLPTDGKV